MTHMFETTSIQPGGIANVSRRFVMKGLVGSGALGRRCRACCRVRRCPPGSTGAGKMPGGTVNDPHVYIAIDPSGLVTIITNRSEMGTGVRTSLPMVVADEMEADWARVRVAQAPGDEKKYGNQDTDGSRSVRHFVQPMRQCGAAMRMMLEQAAATRWGVSVAEVRAREPQGRASGLGQHARLRRTGQGGERAADAAGRQPQAEGPARLPLHRHRVHSRSSICTTSRPGRRRYGIDAKIPGMKFAVIARPPVVGGKLVSFDATEAMKVPGVEKVVEVQGWPWPSKFMPVGGVAVVARNTGLRDQGPRRAEGRLGRRAERELRFGGVPQGRWKQTAASPCKVVRNDGDAEGALKSAAKVVTARVLHSAPGARQHGAADRGRACRPSGKCDASVRAGAEPRRLPRRSGQDARHPGRERHRQRDAAGRRFRPQVEVGLRAGSGAAVEGHRARRSRSSGRARTTSSTTIYHTVSVERIDAGVDAQRQGRRMAAPQRRADDRLDLQGRRRPRGAVRARHGARRQSRSPSPTCAARTARPGAYPHRLVPLGLQHPARLRGAVDGRRRSPQRSGAIRRTCCSNCSGRRSHRRSAQVARGRRLLELRRSARDLSDRHRRGCGASPSSPPSRPGGASSCRRARASASPCIAAS